MASSDSEVETILGPALQGVYIHDPEDPEGTIHQFFYAPSGKVEQRSTSSEMLVFAGRTRPVAEFGENQTDTLDVAFVIPFDGNWAAEVLVAQTAYETNRTYVYRDNRGRFWYGVLREVKFTDTDAGTQVSFTFERVDFSYVPISLPIETLALEA